MVRKLHKRSYRLLILGKSWKITFHAPENYIKISDDSKAITDTHLRQMHFDLEHMCEELARHELAHAYAKELSFVELQLQGEQVEDFFCELVGKHGVTLYKQGKILNQHARKLKWRKSNT